MTIHIRYVVSSHSSNCSCTQRVQSQTHIRPVRSSRCPVRQLASWCARTNRRVRGASRAVRGRDAGRQTYERRAHGQGGGRRARHRGSAQPLRQASGADVVDPGRRLSGRAGRHRLVHDGRPRHGSDRHRRDPGPAQDGRTRSRHVLLAVAPAHTPDRSRNPGDRRGRPVRPLPDRGRRPLPAPHQRRRGPAARSTCRWPPAPTSSTGPPPVDALPALPAWADPGFTWAPDLHRFGPRYVLYFTAMVAGTYTADAVHRQRLRHLARPARSPPSRTPIICQLDQGGSIDPAGVRRRRRHPLDAVEVRPEHRRGQHAHQDVVAAPVRRTDSACSAQPSVLMSPDEPWQGTIVEAPDMVEVGRHLLGRLLGQLVQPAGLRHRGGPLRRAGRSVRRHSPRPLLGSNSQGQGPGEASVFDDAHRRLDALQPVAVARPPNPTSRRGRSTSPGSGSPRPVPTWPPVRCPGRRPAGRPLVGTDTDPTAVGRAAQPRRRRSSAATALPSAWPLVAFMTRPVKNPASLSSPSR